MTEQDRKRILEQLNKKIKEYENNGRKIKIEMKVYNIEDMYTFIERIIKDKEILALKFCAEFFFRDNPEK